MERIGLIAGNGNFPILFAQAAKAKGIKVIAVAIKEETLGNLDKWVEKIYWISVGELKKLLKIFEDEEIKKIIMVGQIKPSHLFSGIEMDVELRSLLEGVKDKRANTIFGTFAEKLKSRGITLIDSTTFLSDLLPGKGILTKNEPSSQQWKDIQFGWDLATRIAGLDIGQTVVIKDNTILAIEAIEGTDEAIKRGGRLGNGNAVVVKVSKPQQDMRFDIPVIGPNTINSMVEVKASVLAIEANKTLLIDKENCIQKADSNNISIVAI